MDCKWIDPSYITVTKTGFWVRVTPEVHPHAWKDGSKFFEYGKSETRISGDDDYHVCIHTGYLTDNNKEKQLWWLCAYYPPGLT